ncbi:MAG: VOC family protein [Alicyclobacillus sp.]|nr:VOC family protein [Alicyclobacillus sp.]
MHLRLELFVNDVQISSEFYIEVLGFQKLKDAPNYVVVKNGNVQLGLGAMAKLPSEHPLRQKFASERKGIGVEIVLETKEIFDMYQRIQMMNYPIAEPITLRPWGLTDFRLLDPDGYYLRVTSM